MAGSDLVKVRTAGREKHYWIDREKWYSFLSIKEEYEWVIWPLLFRSMEIIWVSILEKEFQTDDRLLLSSLVRELMQRIRPALESAGFADIISKDTDYKGESYIPVFYSDINKLLSVL